MPARSPTEPPRAGQFGPDIYAVWRESSLGEITEALEHRLIFRLAGSLHGCSILDVGCGDGTQALLSVGNGADRVTGCDPDARLGEITMLGAAFVVVQATKPGRNGHG
jgi:SAM-dependent methyltransferase